MVLSKVRYAGLVVVLITSSTCSDLLVNTLFNVVLENSAFLLLAF